MSNVSQLVTVGYFFARSPSKYRLVGSVLYFRPASRRSTRRQPFDSMIAQVWMQYLPFVQILAEIQGLPYSSIM